MVHEPVRRNNHNELFILSTVTPSSSYRASKVFERKGKNTQKTAFESNKKPGNQRLCKYECRSSYRKEFFRRVTIAKNAS